MSKTLQEEIWSGNFGKEYTDRNISNPDEVDQYYIKNYGISRTKINEEFLGNLNLQKILEVGCNVGNQLFLLKKMGYTDLWGIELQDYAVEIARKRMTGSNIVKGSAFDIPFKNNFFDMVFTSGVLIHISPEDIEKVLNEIHRCTSKYIFGFEYYSSNGYEPLKYRGIENLLWKTDFSKLFLKRFPDVRLINKKILKYKDNENLDIIYILEKINQ
jgi:pseudaminic acid biosynthesis-associated methylase